MGILEIYILNLILTLGMFVVLIFRAWIELENYRMMWKELEWRQTYQAVGQVLKAEKDIFSKVEAETSCINCFAESSKRIKTKTSNELTNIL